MINTETTTAAEASASSGVMAGTKSARIDATITARLLKVSAKTCYGNSREIYIYEIVHDASK